MRLNALSPHRFIAQQGFYDVQIQIQIQEGATSGAGTGYPSGAPEFTPVISGVGVTRYLVLCACFVDRCLYFFFWPLCFRVLLQYTDSDYPFGIFKLFLSMLFVFI